LPTVVLPLPATPATTTIIAREHNVRRFSGIRALAPDL
jgi:hypothetical protein